MGERMNFTPIASSSKGNAYLVESPGAAPILLEAGIPIKQLREKLWSHGVRLSDLAGCLVSHEHGDHARSVRDVLKAGVDVWTSKETAEVLVVSEHHRCHCIESGKEFVLNGFWIIPFGLHHDVPTQGFFIQGPDGDRLLFIPDTSHVVNRFKNVTILVIEANHEPEILSNNIQDGTIPAVLGRRVRRNHLSLSVVKDFILANNMQKTLREIHLIHLSDTNSSEEQFKREIQEITGIPVHICEE